LAKHIDKVGDAGTHMLPSQQSASYVHLASPEFRALTAPPENPNHSGSGHRFFKLKVLFY